MLPNLLKKLDKGNLVWKPGFGDMVDTIWSLAINSKITLHSNVLRNKKLQTYNFTRTSDFRLDRFSRMKYKCPGSYIGHRSSLYIQ